ncbi:MAG TPA: hypothetical protein DIT07_01885 [Sphingobacteriaceae bacterium]|nr:hypothetical protein [Sphingobacteriaceae bacterium]
MSIEYIVEICVAIDIAILGIAYPIIVDKISNIGDKYTSQYISNLFENEFPQLPIRFKFNKRIYQIPIFKLTPSGLRVQRSALKSFYILRGLRPGIKK